MNGQATMSGNAPAVRASDIGVRRFDSNDLPERDRAEMMREIFGRAIMKLDFEPFAGIPLSMNKVLRSYPDFGLSMGTNSPMNCLRTPPLIDSDDMILTVVLSGSGTICAHGRENQLGGGSAGIVHSGDPHRFIIHSASETMTFRLAVNRIAPSVADFDAVLNKPIASASEPLRLLVRYASALQTDDVLATPELRSMVATHMYDLAALALGATRDAAVLAAGRGMRVARLHAIKADILRNLGARALSIDSIATRHGITPRYVRRLFEHAGMTFSEFVLFQRLERAHRILVDPRQSGRTVSSVAFEAGFGDLSYFNRTFRRRYGASPSGLREAAKQGG